MRRGLKAEARRFALEIREELGLDAFSVFDPYALASEYGIPVYPMSELAKHPEARAAVAHYRNGRSITFSAALVPIGTNRFILDNDSHPLTRRRNSIGHEMAHLLREHSFDQLLLNNDGCRLFNRDKEEEADWVAGELLIPYDAAEHAAILGWSDEQVAEEYEVSVALARMRMNYSGARKVVANRQSFRQRLLN